MVKIRTALSIVFGIFLILAFQNCGKQNLELGASNKTGGSNLNSLICSDKDDGELVTQDTGESRTEEIACTQSGKIVQTFETREVFECQNGELESTGDISETFVGESDQNCVNTPVNCGSVAEGSFTTLVQGSISELVNCSRGVFSNNAFTNASQIENEYTDTYERLVVMTCKDGVLVPTTSPVSKGNLTSGGGSCALSSDCVPSVTKDPACGNDPNDCPLQSFFGFFGHLNDAKVQTIGDTDIPLLCTAAKWTINQPNAGGP